MWSFCVSSADQWCWERWRAGGEGGDRGWDGWMVPPTQWTWVWANSGTWWRTGNPGMLQSMGSQRAGHNWATAQPQCRSWCGACARLHTCAHTQCTHTHTHICKSSEFTSSCLGAYRADFSCASLSYTSSWCCIPEVFISSLFSTSRGHWASVLLTAVGPVVVLGEASWSSQSDGSVCACARSQM